MSKTDGKIYGIQIFQPNVIIKSQREFMRKKHPRGIIIQNILCIISGIGFACWYLNIYVPTSKYIGGFMFLIMVLIMNYYHREYDKQARIEQRRK